MQKGQRQAKDRTLHLVADSVTLGRLPLWELSDTEWLKVRPRPPYAHRATGAPPRNAGNPCNLWYTLPAFSSLYIFAFSRRGDADGAVGTAFLPDHRRAR